MPYTSAPLSLEYWSRLQARVDTEYQAQLGRLQEAFKPTAATVDNFEQVQRNAQLRRDAVFEQLREMESMHVLQMVLGSQVRNALYRAEIPDVEAHIACLRAVAGLFDEFLIGLPRRAPAEQELQNLVTQFAAMRSGGNSETLVAERQRLRTQVLSLPVLGAEDTSDHERSLRSLHANIDQQETALQNLRVSTTMTLRLPDDLAALVAKFGVELTQDVPAQAAPTEES